MPAGTAQSPAAELTSATEIVTGEWDAMRRASLPCIAEAPHLEALKEQGAEIVGVAIRDRPEDVARFLAQHGNPYVRIGRDDLSEVQLAIGSSGVPETFVIDGKGVIRYQHIGDIRESDVPVLLEQLAEARQ